MISQQTVYDRREAGSTGFRQLSPFRDEVPPVVEITFRSPHHLHLGTWRVDTVRREARQLDPRRGHTIAPGWKVPSEVVGAIIDVVANNSNGPIYIEFPAWQGEGTLVKLATQKGDEPPRG